MESISDNTVWYYLGKHKYKWKTGHNVDFKKKIDRKYNITEKNFRQGIISWAKDYLIPPLKDSQEIIHRGSWDLEGLIGENEHVLMHPHYWVLNQFIEKDHKKKHDVLTLFECSNSKPYSQNKLLKRNFFDIYGAFTDFANISNPGVIPVEYSHFYPYRYDEWDHYNESDDISDKYIKVNAYRFVNYVKKMGYKDVLVVMQDPHPQKVIDYCLKNNIGGCKNWLHVIIDKRLLDRAWDMYKKDFGNLGLMMTRLMGLPVLHEKYQRILKSVVKDKDLFEEFQKLYKERKRGSEEIKEFNEEHGWTPVDPAVGYSGSFKGDDPKSAVTESKVKEYEKFIKEYLEKLDKPYWTVLELLLDYGIKEDPDTEYWNMYEAMNRVKNDDIIRFSDAGKDLKEFDYAFFSKKYVDEHDLSQEDIIKDADKEGVIQIERNKK